MYYRKFVIDWLSIYQNSSGDGANLNKWPLRIRDDRYDRYSPAERDGVDEVGCVLQLTTCMLEREIEATGCCVV